MLSAALCLVVFLPPGWCCHVGGSGCCDRAAATGGEVPGPPCGCCCPSDEAASPRPDEPPAPRPVGFCCCCQKYTADRPDPSRGPLVVDALALMPTVQPLLVALGEPIPAEARPVAFSPHLHVLLCVWLC